MLKYFPKFIITVSVLFLIYALYDGLFYDTSKQWINFDEPKPASYTSLDEEEAILERFDQQQYADIKEMNPADFNKNNIFEPIQ